jgi:hypothetical protein
MAIIVAKTPMIKPIISCLIEFMYFTFSYEKYVALGYISCLFGFFKLGLLVLGCVRCEIFFK